ncbi:hypothetical protein [Pseudorhodoferax sp.]|uniref:hypothetical protein n=1 Tax=Pseudorhodoferax sp. TaxID=1993553 RepID=UPI0039E5E3B3
MSSGRSVRAWAVAGGWLGLAMASWAQGTTPTGPEQMAAERARIAAERVRIDQRFQAEERACYQRFAVNDCLARNLAWQREALGALRRQEILLNDSERQRRGAERLEKLDEKAREQQGVPAPDGAASGHETRQAPRPAGGKLPRDDKPVRTPDAAQVEQHQQRMQRKQEQHAEDAARRSERAAQAADDARRHQDRVRAAEERRQRVQERNAANPSKAAPLPPQP